jgi:hypothetical protein
MDPEVPGPSADRIRQGKIVVDAVEVSDGRTRERQDVNSTSEHFDRISSMDLPVSSGQTLSDMARPLRNNWVCMTWDFGVVPPPLHP